MLSNDELFAKAHWALWLYEQDLSAPLNDAERRKFITEFIVNEQKPKL